MASCEGCTNQAPDGMCDPLYKATNTIREKDALIAYQREQIAKLVARDQDTDARNTDITRVENQALRDRVAELVEDRSKLSSELGGAMTVVKMFDRMDFMISRARQYIGEPNPGDLKLPEIFEKLLGCCIDGDSLINGYGGTLDLIPDCTQHGRRCLPHCADWIKAARRHEDAACGKCEPSMELDAMRKQFGAFFREVLKMPCPIWLEDCLPAIARQVEALRVAVDDSTKTCGECQTAKELDSCFTDLKKYKKFYDTYQKIQRSKVYGCKCCAWRGELPDPTVKRDAQVIAPGAADFGDRERIPPEKYTFVWFRP